MIKIIFCYKIHRESQIFLKLAIPLNSPLIHLNWCGKKQASENKLPQMATGFCKCNCQKFSWWFIRKPKISRNFSLKSSPCSQATSSPTQQNSTMRRKKYTLYYKWKKFQSFLFSFVSFFPRSNRNMYVVRVGCA